MKTGQVLGKLLKKRGRSLSRLANESRVPKSTIHNWTVGRSTINLNQLKQVANVLEVSIHELAFGEPDPHVNAGEELLKEIFSGDVRVTLHRIERRS